MNYFSKTQAENIRAEFAYLIGRACFFNDIKEEAILKEIKVIPSYVNIRTGQEIQPGYTSVFCFDNSKLVRPDLFAHFNQLKRLIAPYKGMD
jgi:hypothetical protein